MKFWPLTNSDYPTNQTFHQFHDLDTDFDLHRITSGFHGAFATGVACQQGTLTLPDTWFRPPFWDLLMLQLLRPNSSNLPCLYSTFHFEYSLVLSRFCSDHFLFLSMTLILEILPSWHNLGSKTTILWNIIEIQHESMWYMGMCALRPWPWRYDRESRWWRTIGSWITSVWNVIHIGQGGKKLMYGHDVNRRTDRRTYMVIRYIPQSF